MNDESKGCWGCLIGILEMIGFFVVIAWPILLLLLINNP